MASIRREIVVDARPEDVWDALRDVGALHTRLVPGFVTDTRLERGARVVTFFTGAVARELIITVDEESRRVVWAAVSGPLNLTHHNASAQVLVGEAGGTRFVWLADFRPDEASEAIAGLMDQGLAALKKTMEAGDHVREGRGRPAR